MEDRRDLSRLQESYEKLSEEWYRKEGIRIKNQRVNGVYHEPLTVWLMLAQRLGKLSLKDVVWQELISPSKYTGLLCGGKSSKLRERKVSSASGGYSRARDRLGIGHVYRLSKHCTEQLMLREGEPPESIFIIDGTTLTVRNTKENVARFKQHRIKDGTLYYPKVRVVVAHQLENGIPTIPVYGSYEQSELELVIRVIEQLPEHALVIADRYFGCFQFLKRLHDRKLRGIIRIKQDVFHRLAGHKPSGTYDAQVTWTPSKKEQSGHGFTADEAISGRVIQFIPQLDGKRAEPICFFVTTDEPVESIAQNYLYRLRIETWFRQIKQSLKLSFIDAKSPEMIEKEIVLAFLAFALVCATIDSVAKEFGVPPIRMSFTGVLTALRGLATACDQAPKEAEASRRRTMVALKGEILPNRTKRRSYPRVIRTSPSQYSYATTVEKVAKL